ncbi:Hypothetical protein A7982_02069 [Minicystis rosea]|nr:Hypothetical protein A7982_02069 [Minicystis rosea]
MRNSTRTSLVASVFAAAAVIAASAPAFAASHGVVRGEGWGNGQFGSSYDLWMGVKNKQMAVSLADPVVQSTLNAILPADYIQIGATLSASATAFGVTNRIAHGEATATRWNGSIASRYDLELMGQVLFSGSLGSTVTFSKSTEFFKAEETFWIEFVPITVSASVSGSLGITASGSISASNFSVTGTPYAKAYVDGSVGLGVECVSAGIEGELTALEARMPITATTSLLSGVPNIYTVNARLALTTLDGSFGFYADGCVDRVDYTLVSWPGVHLAEWSLLNVAGTW